jgi:hypothetical protein
MFHFICFELRLEMNRTQGQHRFPVIAAPGKGLIHVFA